MPFFVLGFIAFIVVRTAGDALFHAPAPLWQALVNTGYGASDLFLTCGMTAVGLSVSFTDMWRIGWRPLAAGLAVATLVGGCSLLLSSALLHFFTDSARRRAARALLTLRAARAVAARYTL